MKPTRSILFLTLIGAVPAGGAADTVDRPMTAETRNHYDYTQSASKDPYPQNDKNQIAPDQPCPPGKSVRTDSTSIHIDTERAPEANRSSIEQELRRSIGRFDELLLREQARVKAAAPDSRESGTFPDDNVGSEENDEDRDGENAGRRKEPRNRPGNSTTTPPKAPAKGKKHPDGAPTQGQGRTGSQGGDPRPGRNPTPDDADDGSDDDVVARQLREAAENETDPELRKRLWEEYRHYKQGR